MIMWLARSRAVIESMMATTRVISFSSTLTFFRSLSVPTLRHHAEERFERAQLADLLHLVAEILEREVVVDELALHLLGLLLVDGLLDLLDEG